MTRIPSGRRFIALASILTLALATGACEYSRSNRHHGGYNGSYDQYGGSHRPNDQHGDYNRSKDYQGHYKDNKGNCYERVREVDRYTGQTHYVDRPVPCKNGSKDYHRAYKDNKDNKGGYYKDNKGTCYERVHEVDRSTGQTHYVDRPVPCRK
jgi:hypothetical protein